MKWIQLPTSPSMKLQYECLYCYNNLMQVFSVKACWWSTLLVPTILQWFRFRGPFSCWHNIQRLWRSVKQK
jgi:hypothetical protein